MFVIMSRSYKHCSLVVIVSLPWQKESDFYKCCLIHSKSICLSYAGTINKRWKLGSCSLHHQIAKGLGSFSSPLPSTRQHPSYGDCLEVKREYYQNYSVLDCVTQCSQSAAHLYEQFLQVWQIGLVTLGPLRCA